MLYMSWVSLPFLSTTALDLMVPTPQLNNPLLSRSILSSQFLQTISSSPFRVKKKVDQIRLISDDEDDDDHHHPNLFVTPSSSSDQVNNQSELVI